MTRAAALLAAAVAAGGCGGGAVGAGPERLVVAAAASLAGPLTRCGPVFEGARVRRSFAGSDELAAQIRRGVRPDVFAAANTELPRRLAREGLVERPRRFAANELVVAVARDSPVRRVEDLARRGVTVATGAPSVPVGAYTRTLLGRLAPATARAIAANVRTEEPDVRGVVGKVAQGAVDAGFVYVSDVAAAGGRLRAVRLPERVGPAVAYAAAVVRGAASPALARRYVASLVDGPCAEALRTAGLRPPAGR